MHISNALILPLLFLASVPEERAPLARETSAVQEPGSQDPADAEEEAARAAKEAKAKRNERRRRKERLADLEDQLPNFERRVLRSQLELRVVHTRVAEATRLAGAREELQQRIVEAREADLVRFEEAEVPLARARSQRDLVRARRTVELFRNQVAEDEKARSEGDDRSGAGNRTQLVIVQENLAVVELEVREVEGQLASRRSELQLEVARAQFEVEQVRSAWTIESAALDLEVEQPEYKLKTTQADYEEHQAEIARVLAQLEDE